MHKIMFVVGARPQFIKLAMVHGAMQDRFSEVIVHTGQHFDKNMSGIFFKELGIREPDYNLGISGGSHSQMVARMMIKLEEVMSDEKPEAVLVVGDTNSTLAAALTAAKLYIPLIHVEAGTRTHSMTNPEEINRICTDHVSSLRFTSTKAALDELYKENLINNSFFSGNTMYDAFLKYQDMVSISDVRLKRLNGEFALVPDRYYYMTCHREENTSDPNKLANILRAMNLLGTKTIYPVHPRNRVDAINIVKEEGLTDIILCEPAGYFENIALIKGCEGIVTDSGGLQTEAFFAKKKCVTILDFICWPETLKGGRNEHARADTDDILEKISHDQIIDEVYEPFGDGHAADFISDKISEFLKQ